MQHLISQKAELMSRLHATRITSAFAQGEKLGKVLIDTGEKPFFLRKL